MNEKDKLWIKLMDWCSKYWGCHQLPERSFFICGYQFPVCARCTGIIVGYIISFLYAMCFVKMKFVLEILFIIPMVFDGLLQFLTNYLSTNIKRFVTGVLAGFGFIQMLKSIILFTFDSVQKRNSRIHGKSNRKAAG